ncbi:hypothetical protein [Spirochaeta thermophila]|nr:hypothetical protein [Spirochaeta thermophila]
MNSIVYRASRYLMRDALLRRDSLYTIPGVVAALSFVFMCLGLSVDPQGGDASAYLFIFSFTGWVSAAAAHKELQQKGTRHEWYTLPLASWEKTIYRMIPSLIIWPLVCFPLIWVGRMLAVLVFALFDPAHHAGFLVPLYPPGVGDALLTYLLGHALFYFGGVYFTSHPVGKTVLASLGGMIFLSAIVVFSIWAWSKLRGVPFGGFDGFSFPLGSWRMFSIGLSLFTSVWFWVLSYFRIREREARGV